MSTKYPAVEDDGALEVHESVERFEDLLYMVPLNIQLYDFTTRLFRERDYAFPRFQTNRPIQYTVPVLRNPYQMVLAMPYGVC